MYSLTLKYPKDTLRKVLKVRKKIEYNLGVKLAIDLKNEILTIQTEENTYVLYEVKDIIDAIDVGFKFDIAMLLALDNFRKDAIDVKSISRNKKDLRRIMSRIIGKEGYAKKKIEDLCEVFLAIDDKKGMVYIIGEEENVDLAKEALRLLINGKKHKTVYDFIIKHKPKR